MNTATATPQRYEGHVELWLIRHGETAWSLSGQHTGRTDIALTERGHSQAQLLAPLLAAQPFEHVLTSPMSRAIETCREAGLGERAGIEPDLHEWDYGIYEGRTTAEIRKTEPDWCVWHSLIPHGESVTQVEARARGVVESLLAMLAQGASAGQGGAGRRIAVFSHAHFLRVLAGCWISDSAAPGAHLYLDTATISIVGFDRESRAIRRWNARPEGCE